MKYPTKSLLALVTVAALAGCTTQETDGIKDMLKGLIWLSALFFWEPVLAVDVIDAEIEGDRYLGNIGNHALITLGKERCTVSAIGKRAEQEYKPLEFVITLQCGSKKQILWDINNVAEDEYSFDEPRFGIEWAGDRDGDGKIDLVMDMSPKYSCWKIVTYLSSKAATTENVGIIGEPDMDCGC